MPSGSAGANTCPSESRPWQVPWISLIVITTFRPKVVLLAGPGVSYRDYGAGIRIPFATNNRHRAPSNIIYEPWEFLSVAWCLSRITFKALSELSASLLAFHPCACRSTLGPTIKLTACDYHHRGYLVFSAERSQPHSVHHAGREVLHSARYDIRHMKSASGLLVIQRQPAALSAHSDLGTTLVSNTARSPPLRSTE